MAIQDPGGPTTRPRSTPSVSVVVIGLVVVLVVLVGITIYAVSRGRERQEIPYLAGSGAVTGVGSGALQSEVGVSLEDLAQRPRRYIGTTVTVAGQVGQVLNPRAFTLRREGLLEYDSALVVIPQNLAAVMTPATALRPGTALTVTGTVRQFDPNVFERDLGIDLDRGLWGDFENHPLIVADLIQGARVEPGFLGQQRVQELQEPPRGVAAGVPMVPPTGIQPFNQPIPQPVPEGAVAPGARGPAAAGVGAGVGAGLGTGVGAGAAVGQPGQLMAGQVPVVTLDQIVDNPRAFVGRTVAVEGAIAQPLGRRAAVLRDLSPAFANELLVVSPRPLPNLATPTTQLFNLQDNIVRILGTVTVFDLNALEQQLGVGLDPTLLGPYQGQLALVARDVTRFVTVNRLEALPQAFAGTSVTTAGYIEAILSPNAFVLHDPDRLQGADVLVLSQQPLWVAGQNRLQPFMFEGNQVQVTGTLQPGGNLDAIVRQLGIQADVGVLGRYAERPVLIATRITAQ